MSEETHKNSEIRSYLLGDVPTEEEKVKIEERLMLDDEYFQKFSIEEEELIQDYVDDCLNAEERRNFENNFLVSAERHNKLSFARALREFIDEEGFQNGGKTAPDEIRNKREAVSFFKSFHSPRRRGRAIALGAFVFACFVAGFAWIYLINPAGDGENQKVLASLNKAYAGQRPFESRISGFDYAPVNNLRGGDERETSDKLARDRAKLLSSELAEKSGTAEILHTQARIYLAEGDFETALKQLEKARAAAPQNAEILSDLGVVYLEKSKRNSGNGGVKLDLAAAALESINRALEIDPKLPAARFNRALTLQELLYSTEEARRAWQEYLRIDDNSKWAEEARRKLASLESDKPQSKTKDELLNEFLDSYRQKNDNAAWRIVSRNREMIKGRLIHHQLAFLFLNAANGDKKDEYLAALKYAGELEKQKTGDPYFAEIAAFYAAVSPEKQALLKAGHSFLSRGFQLDLDGNYREAYEEFKRAETAFGEAGSVWEARLAEYWAAFCRYNQAELAEHHTTLERLAAFCQAKNYKWFLAEIYIWLGVNAEESTEYSRAIEYHKKAVELCEEISDTYNLQKTLAILADEYAYLKQYEPSLASVQKSLVLSAQIPETGLRQKWRNFNTAARIFYGLKRYSAAVAFEREALAIGEEANDLTFKRDAALNLAIIYGRQGKYADAIDFLNISKAAAEALPDESTRTRYLAAIHTQSANFKRLSGAGAFGETLDEYNKAIEYSRAKYKPEEYNARKGRLLYYAAQKNSAALDEEIPALLELFEQNRRQITEEASRNTFFDSEQDVYELAIDFEYNRQNLEQAFNYSETSRSRSLLDFLKYGAKASDEETAVRFPDIAKPLKLEEIRRNLPEQAQLVQYAMLNDKVLIWLITKNDFTTRSVSVSAEALNSKVTAYLDCLIDRTRESGETFEEAQNLSKEIYQILIAPVLDKLDSTREIVFIPDKVLFRLPFSALVSPDTGKFLIEDFTTFYAPSSNVFLISTANAVHRKSPDPNRENLLVIGNPAFDPVVFTNLPNLPNAAAEAEKIAELYRNTNLLIDGKATKSEVKRRLPQAGIIHFAGHYVVDQTSPMRSFLLLAGSGDDAILSNYELVKENLTPRAGLIILSACETGAERYYNGEGMISAARTFLGTSIPLVVASHWKVDSQATEKLMTRFHHYRTRENLSTVAALRRSQLEMLKEDAANFRKPFYWAAFAPIGGYTQF